MNIDYELGQSDLHPGRWAEPENPFETYEKAVGAWHDREEKAWRIAGCPADFEFDEDYPVRPRSEV